MTTEGLTPGEQIREGIRENYKDEDGFIWLTMPHKLLNGRIPLDVLAEDGPAGAEKLLQLLDQLSSGAFI